MAVNKVSNDLKKYDHYHPMNDQQEHTLTARCKCKPVVDNRMRIIIHNSFDCREMFERDDEGITLYDGTPSFVFFVTGRSQ